VVEHEADSLFEPGHCFPSYAGAGFEQVLVRNFVPVVVLPDLHVIEHDPHANQDAHFPSTVLENFNQLKNYDQLYTV
jgi:hypothetical protein